MAIGFDVSERPALACVLWDKAKTGKSGEYGHLYVDGVHWYAHRLAYAALVGPIPEGYEVDHLCSTTLCINPVHLEAVTPTVNRQRQHARRAQRRYCKYGHRKDGPLNRGVPSCRICHNESSNRYNAQQRAA